MNTDTIEVIRKTVAEETRAVVSLSHVPVILLPVCWFACMNIMCNGDT